MIYDWTELGINEIVNLFLFGTIETPENLANAEFIRPANATASVEVETASYMETGPGRFAFAPLSSIVETFFAGDHPQFANTGVHREFTKQQMVNIVGGQHTITIQQTNYDDATDDYAYRSFVFNTSGFEISDDAIFIVEEDGTLTIENFAIYARTDNFDFVSSDAIATLGNDAILKPNIDPSNIGRRLDIEFVNREDVPTRTYTLEDFQQDVETAEETFDSALVFTKLPGSMFTVVDELAEAGVTSYLDSEDRPVLYGTAGIDDIAVAELDEGDYPGLADSLENGVVLVGGAGNDILTGGDSADVLLGGDGNDRLAGGTDDDLLEGGAGTNTYVLNEGDGVDTIIDETGFGRILWAGIQVTGVAGADDDGQFSIMAGGQIFNLALDAESGALSITKADSEDGIIVENFQDGYFGIFGLPSQQSYHPAHTLASVADSPAPIPEELVPSAALAGIGAIPSLLMFAAFASRVARGKITGRF